MRSALLCLLYLLVLILMSGVANATSLEEQPIPALNGAKTQTHWVPTDPRSFVDQGYIRAELGQKFPTLVRMLGGKHVNGPLLPGQRLIVFSASTEQPILLRPRLDIGWGTIAGQLGRVTVNMTATLYRILPDGSRGYICDRSTQGSSSLSGLALENLQFGKIGYNSIRVSGGRVNPLGQAEINAYKNAIDAFADQPQRQTGKHEPIVIMGFGPDGEITISGGKAQGVREGQVFAVYRGFSENPNTGEQLEPDGLLGTIMVTSVTDTTAFCEVRDGDIHTMAKGDLCQPIQANPKAAPAVAPEPL
jgi:hypothetical protein